MGKYLDIVRSYSLYVVRTQQIKFLKIAALFGRIEWKSSKLPKSMSSIAALAPSTSMDRPSLSAVCKYEIVSLTNGRSRSAYNLYLKYTVANVSTTHTQPNSFQFWTIQPLFAVALFLVYTNFSSSASIFTLKSAYSRWYDNTMERNL